MSLLETEQERLMLQHFVDHDPKNEGHYAVPSSLGNAHKTLIEKGLLTLEFLPRESMHKTGYYFVTEEGRAALKSRNSELGSSATRLVSRVRYFDPLEPVPYGWPIAVPLSKKVKFIDGILCETRMKRSLWSRLMGTA